MVGGSPYLPFTVRPREPDAAAGTAEAPEDRPVECSGQAVGHTGWQRDQFVAELSEEGFSPSGRHAEVVFTSLLRKRKKNTKEQQTLSHKKQEGFGLGSRALQKIKKMRGGKCLNV